MELRSDEARISLAKLPKRLDPSENLSIDISKTPCGVSPPPLISSYLSSVCFEMGLSRRKSLHLATRALFECWDLRPGSRILLNPGSWILDPGSRILDPRCWILDPTGCSCSEGIEQVGGTPAHLPMTSMRHAFSGSWIPNLGCCILDPESRILDPGCSPPVRGYSRR